MTSIDFYFNVADKSGLVVSLVQTALARQQRVTISTGNAQTAAEISQALWQNEPTSFLPNAFAQHPQAAQTPVLLHWGEAEFTQDEILINISMQQLGSFSRFKQLVELVGQDEQDKASARERYKFYRDRGYTIRNIDQSR